jgi:hypothetical protein
MSEKQGLPLYLRKCIRVLKRNFNSRPFTANEARRILPGSKSYQYFLLFKLVRAGRLERFGPGVYQVAKAMEEPRMSVYLTDVGEKIKKYLIEEGIYFIITGLDVLIVFAHHLPFRFFHLLYVEKGSEEWTQETLGRDSHLRCLINPNPREISIGSDMAQEAELIVLRPTSSFYAVEDGVATLERALTDLYFEISRKGFIFDLAEFVRIFYNVTSTRVINYPRLFRYANRRNVGNEITYLLREFSKNIDIPEEYLKKKIKFGEYIRKLQGMSEVIRW